MSRPAPLRAALFAAASSLVVFGAPLPLPDFGGARMLTASGARADEAPKVVLG
ncbi:hypothetical protein [Roseiarcus fermentans]|uniref:hypothetical protein n=1 Tax=Roseiarcus fermentans TaxID=1473586 RepID=UPI0014729B86|nr:hypothetical protein [Roseiarcus fermentans]